MPERQKYEFIAEPGARPEAPRRGHDHGDVPAPRPDVPDPDGLPWTLELLAAAIGAVAAIAVSVLVAGGGPVFGG